MNRMTCKDDALCERCGMRHLDGEPFFAQLIDLMFDKANDQELLLRARCAAYSSPTFEYVLAFALEMEGKLSQNRHKGDREGWVNDHPLALLCRIEDEVAELKLAIVNGETPGEVTKEAADIGNFAMMVADAYRHHRALSKRGS